MNITSVIKIEEGLYNIQSMPCIHCKTDVTIQITAPQLWAYNNGASIQEVLPDESLAVREQFITGTCETCWDNMFGTEEAE